MIVVITGASAGLGRAAARAFAADGWDVGLLARGEDGLESAADEIRAAGRQALAIPVDVADASSVDAAAERVEAELGPIDAWVNNAMESVFAPVDQIAPDEYRRITDVNYLGYVHGTLAALKRMKLRDRGVIVQVGSALAYRSIPLQAAYCASKHAIVGFTDSLRCELLHERSGIRITMVQLPALNTPQFEVSRTRLPRHPQPVPPIYQPEVAADAIVWAAEHARRELHVGGSTLVTILGNKVAPAVADRYLARTAYDAQQSEEPVDPDRPDNLFEPVPGDHGAHGIFEDRSHERSIQLSLTKHRGLLGSLALAALALGLRRT